MLKPPTPTTFHVLFSGKKVGHSKSNGHHGTPSRNGKCGIISKTTALAPDLSCNGDDRSVRSSTRSSARDQLSA